MKDYGITCDCGCQDNVNEKDEKRKGIFLFYIFDIIKLFISLILIVIGLIVDNEISIIFYIISSILLGYKLMFSCIKQIRQKNIFNENFLMLIASIVAYLIGEHIEGTLIIFLYCLGAFLEDVATYNTKTKIVGLSELRTEIVHFVNEKGIFDKCPSEIPIGSIIEVRHGEKIAIDGIIIGQSGEFDTKYITGESVYSVKKHGEQVYSGFINVGSPVLIKTTKLFADSTVEKMIDLVSNANSNKSNRQKFITRFAKIYTPIILILCFLLAVVPPLIDDYNFFKWIHKALSFLVISCPCALVISVPLAYFVGIGVLAKNGILIKGSKYIETLFKVKTFIFDKTGTITSGNLSVIGHEFNKDIDNEKIIEYIVSIESKSNHPISRAILNCFNDVKRHKANDIEEIAGLGIKGKINDDIIKIGNRSFVGEVLEIEKDNDEQVTTIYVSINENIVGKIFLKDLIKKESEIAIKQLKAMGIEKMIMLSGDNEKVAKNIGEKVNMDEIYFELLPQDKLNHLSNIQKQSKNFCAYVGDGINDMLCLKNADIGIAMGGLGCDLAIENSDMVILDDNLTKLPFAKKVAKAVQKTTIFNIVFSLLFKFLIMLLSIIFAIPTWLVMFGDVGVMLIAVLNSLKNGLIKKK